MKNTFMCSIGLIYLLLVPATTLHGSDILDQSFGNEGWMDIEVSNDFNSPWAADLVIRPDQRINLVARQNRDFLNKETLVISQIKQDGGLDPRFNEGKNIVLNTKQSSFYARSALVQNQDLFVYGTGGVHWIQGYGSYGSLAAIYKINAEGIVANKYYFPTSSTYSSCDEPSLGAGKLIPVKNNENFVVATGGSFSRSAYSHFLMFSPISNKIVFWPNANRKVDWCWISKTTDVQQLPSAGFVSVTDLLFCLYNPIGQENICPELTFWSETSPPVKKVIWENKSYPFKDDNGRQLPSSVDQLQVLNSGEMVALVSVGGLGLALVKLFPDGKVDPNFGTNGIALVPNHKLIGPAHSILVKGDKILLFSFGGSYDGNPTPHLDRILRFNSNGSLDQTFGNGGMHDLEQDFWLMKVAVQDQKVVIAGAYRKYENNKFLWITRIGRLKI